MRLFRLPLHRRGGVPRGRPWIVNEQEACSYWLSNGNIVTVIGEGFPVNFNDIKVVSLGLAAAVQAMRGDELRFEDLNEPDRRMLDDYFERFLDSLEGPR